MAKKRQAVIADALELDVIQLLIVDPRFYARVAHALKVEMLPTDHARLVLGIAHAFHKETSNAKLSLSVVAQRLARQREEGRLTSEDVDDAFDWVEEVLARPVPEREGVIHEVATEIKRAQHQQHVQRAMEVAAKRGSLKEVADAIQETERLGAPEERRSLSWDETTVEGLGTATQVERLRTGIEGLDFAMEGGLPRACLIYALATQGAGKSMLLSQVGAEAMAQGHNPYIATLEVSEEKWGWRLQAAASEIPIRSIRDGELTSADKVQLRDARCGQIARIEHFPAGTPVEELLRAFDAANLELESRGSGRRYTVLIVDYADLLAWPTHIKSNDTYNGQKYVYTALRQFAHERHLWVVTASQATRRDRKKAKDQVLTLDDSADSIHKARIADVGFTLNVSADRQLIRVYLDKNRDGDGGYLSDYLDTAYAYGRITKRPPEPELLEEPVAQPRRTMTSQDLPF